MYLKLRASIEAKSHIRIAYRELVGKTMYAAGRGAGGTTRVNLRPHVYRDVPDDWLESEDERIIEMLDLLTDSEKESETIYSYLNLDRQIKIERMGVWDDVEKYFEAKL